MANEFRVGIDFGGVIVRSNPGVAFEDTPDPTLAWLTVPGAVEGVAALVERTGGNVWIVSKAYPRTQARTRSWMNAARFYRRSGLGAAQVRFCLEREQKADHCVELGITHFVDDSVDVMRILREVVPNLYRFASEAEREDTPPFATHVSSWEEVVSTLQS